MNAGFSNLATIKNLLLGETSIESETQFDAVITALGLGVVGQFEKHCGRKFQRQAGVTQIIPADRAQFLLNRYPVEVVTQWELKQDEQDGFVVQDITQILTTDLESGIVYMPETNDVGKYYHQVRFTFTGGYFWETLDKGEAGWPTAIPATANILPPDLFNIWTLQVRHLWKNIDKLGREVLSDEEVKSLPKDFAPTVEDNLSAYIRYNLA